MFRSSWEKLTLTKEKCQKYDFVKQNDSKKIAKHPLSVYSCWRSDPETRSAAR